MSSIKVLGILALAIAVAGCTQKEVGIDAKRFGSGETVERNIQVQSGALSSSAVLAALTADFRQSARDTINFAFNSTTLEPEARQILDGQAVWIRQHPAIRLRIYGHTDLVGSNAYNQTLGQRRADAAAAYLVARGVSPRQLEAVVSFGKTRPVVFTNDPDRRNRRTVTEVFGFVGTGNAPPFDGKRAEAVYENYVTGATEDDGAGEAAAIFLPQ